MTLRADSESMATASSGERPLRVVVVQPSMAHYRVPFFQRLAEEDGISLFVLYGEDPGIRNVAPEGFRSETVSDRHLGIGRFKPFSWQTAHLRYARKERADVLVMVWNTRWPSVFLGVFLARLTGVRTVLWGHGYSKQDTPLRARLREWLGCRADALLLYSREVAERLRPRVGTRVAVAAAPNSLAAEPIQKAADAWSTDPERLAAFRREHELGENTPVILFVSRIEPANRLDLLIEAASLLTGEFPDLRVHLIGSGGEMITQLREQVDALGLGRVVRMPGPVYGEDSVAPWFLTATVYCYPQNVGLSIQHAMNFGLPVVTCDNPDVQNPEVEALKPGSNGLTYRAGSAADLARVLGELLREPDRARRLGEAAAETMRTSYGLDRMAEGFMEAVRGAQ